MQRFTAALSNLTRPCYPTNSDKALHVHVISDLRDKMDNPSEIVDCAGKQGTICHITLVCTRLRKNAMYVMGDRCLITLRADVQAVRRARRFTSGTVRRSHDGHSAHAPRRGALASRRHRSHDDVIRYHGNCRRRRSGRRRMSAGAVASAPA